MIDRIPCTHTVNVGCDDHNRGQALQIANETLTRWHPELTPELRNGFEPDLRKWCEFLMGVFEAAKQYNRPSFKVRMTWVSDRPFLQVVE